MIAASSYQTVYMCRIIEKWRNKQKLLTKVSVTAFWPLATFTQDSLVITPQPSSAQPSPGLRRRNFHTFSTFHSFYNNLTLTQTPHRRLYSGKMGTEIVFPPILTIFSFCRCRISPVWFSSDIQRSNTSTREG